MAYQTVWMAWYDSKNIINWPFKNFIKQVLVDSLTVIIASLVSFKIPMLSITYGAFFVRAIEVFVCWGVIVFLINALFYSEKIKRLTEKLTRRIKLV